MVRRARLVAFIASLALAAAASCSGQKGDIVIGVVGPLSGPLSFIGEAQKRGAEIAAEEINDSGGIGGRQVRLVVRDDSRFSRIVSILRELTTRERAVAIVGPETATPVLGRNNPAARAGVPVLLPYAPLRGVSPPAADNVFRLAPADSDQATVLARWLVRERKLRSVAIAHSGDTTGKEGARLVARAIRRAGGRVAGSTGFPPGDLDQTSTARRLRRTGARALLVWGTPLDSARVVKAARRIGWRPQVAGPLSLFVSEYRSSAGTDSDDTAFVLPFRRDWFSVRTAAWFLRYHGKFGLVTLPRQRTLIPDLPILAMSAYDAVLMAATAAAAAGGNPRRMVKALEGMRDFRGVATRYTFGARDHEAYEPGDLWMARFLNFAVVYDVDRRADRKEQIAFYKIQVSAFYVPAAFFRTEAGAELQERILEDVLTNPEDIDFFTPYRAPRPPPGPI